LRFGVGLRGLAAAAALIALLHPCRSAADQAAISRGAYLATAAGCAGCHTDSEHRGQPYAGGLPLATEFGIIPTPNITPDPATGIGRWSVPDFARAMRWGIAPDDSHYVPTFPYLFYNRLTDRDLADLKAFLDSLPAVSRPDLKGAGSTALLARTQAALAVSATPVPGPWQPDPQKDAVWNRGAYLVASIGRCGECHTPRNWLGAPDPERFLAGSLAGPGGKKAPNITQDTKSGIGNWSEQDILGVLTDGRTPDFDEVGGAMAEIVKNTARLTEEDRHAIVVFLQSVPPKPFAGKE
jgi:mono/diheme cytochrome c family protein